MPSKFNTIDEVRKFFNACVAHWMRQGDPRSVAACKAFWWDIVECANVFDAWSPAKEQFALEFRGYHRGDPEPEPHCVETGNA